MSGSRKYESENRHCFEDTNKISDRNLKCKESFLICHQVLGSTFFCEFIGLLHKVEIVDKNSFCKHF